MKVYSLNLNTEYEFSIISEQAKPHHQEDTKADIDAYFDDEVNDPDFDPKEPEFDAPKPAKIPRLVIPKIIKPKICKSNDWAKIKPNKTSPSKKVWENVLDLKKSTEFEDYQKRVKSKMDALDPDHKFRVNGPQKKEKDKSAESFTKIAIDLNTKEFRCMKCKDVKGKKTCDFTKNLKKIWDSMQYTMCISNLTINNINIIHKKNTNNQVRL